MLIPQTLSLPSVQGSDKHRTARVLQALGFVVEMVPLTEAVAIVCVCDSRGTLRAYLSPD